MAYFSTCRYDEDAPLVEIEDEGVEGEHNLAVVDDSQQVGRIVGLNPVVFIVREVSLYDKQNRVNQKEEKSQSYGYDGE